MNVTGQKANTFNSSTKEQLQGHYENIYLATQSVHLN